MHEDDWVVDGLVELWRLMEIVGKLELDGVSIGEEPHWPSGLRTPRLQRWCRTAHTCTGREAECHACASGGQLLYTSCTSCPANKTNRAH